MAYSITMRRDGGITERELQEALEAAGDDGTGGASRWRAGEAIFDGPPDDDVLALIIRAAQHLGATVVGDDGQRYTLVEGRIIAEEG